MSFLDEGTGFPVMPFSTFVQRGWKAAVHWQNYNLVHGRLLDNGFSFINFQGPAYAQGTDAKLKLYSEVERGPEPEEDPEGTYYVSRWETDWDSGGWLPKQAEEGWNGEHLWPAVIRSMKVINGTNSYGDSWLYWGLQAAQLLLRPERDNGRFHFHLALRSHVRFEQLRCAMMLEIILCLDNRGRPKQM